MSDFHSQLPSTIAPHIAQDPNLFDRQCSFSQYHIENVVDDGEMLDDYLELDLPQTEQQAEDFDDMFEKQYDPKHYDAPSEHQFTGAHEPWYVSLKQEPPTETEELEPQQQASSAGPMRTNPRKLQTTPIFTPKTTARKYTPRPEHEKKSDNYKLKRERNNDAVRRSRNKAKIEQMKRDQELQDLRDEVTSLKKQNQSLVRKLTNCKCQPRH